MLNDISVAGAIHQVHPTLGKTSIVLSGAVSGHMPPAR